VNQLSCKHNFLEETDKDVVRAYGFTNCTDGVFFLSLSVSAETGGNLMKKVMGKLMAAAVCVLLACAGMSCSKKASSANSASGNGVSPMLQKARASGVLKVGSSGDAPFAYINQKTGSFDGVDADIIKEAAKRMGINKVEMELIPFSELILNLTSGNIDVITDCMYSTAERAKKVYFGDIWYTQGGGLLVSEKSPINGQAQFDPKTTRVGYTAGTIWQKFIEKWKADGLIKEAVSTGDQSESIVALQYGKIDAFLTDSTVIEDLFANSPDTIKGLRLCTEYKSGPEETGHIAPAVTFENIAFMKEINAVVMQMRDEGVIDKIFAKYGLDPKLHAISNDPSQRVCTVNSRDE
jgi:polar amino acid transport system substrate-binding protein